MEIIKVFCCFFQKSSAFLKESTKELLLFQAWDIMMDKPALYELGGVAPKIAESAWVAPGAVVIGAVSLEAEASIWFNCMLRADTNTITIGARTNIQDGTIIHVNAGPRYAAKIGADVTIGHAAIIHACILEDRAFVAMGAIVLDAAVIEEGGMLGAGGLLPPGKRIGRNELWMGSPAKLVRVMSAEERAGHDLIVPHYVERAALFRAGLKPV
jgi:carbonic anhydrase/acetyltransferase-like protein (isoleucine patch superfamily)